MVSLRVVLHMMFLKCKHASGCCNLVDDCLQDQVKLKSLSILMNLSQACKMQSRFMFTATKTDSLLERLPISETLKKCFCAHFTSGHKTTLAANLNNMQYTDTFRPTHTSCATASILTGFGARSFPVLFWSILMLPSKTLRIDCFCTT